MKQVTKDQFYKYILNKNITVQACSDFTWFKLNGVVVGRTSGYLTASEDDVFELVDNINA